jgi:hypothetical protein
LAFIVQIHYSKLIYFDNFNFWKILCYSWGSPVMQLWSEFILHAKRFHVNLILCAGSSINFAAKLRSGPSFSREFRTVRWRERGGGQENSVNTVLWFCTRTFPCIFTWTLVQVNIHGKVRVQIFTLNQNHNGPFRRITFLRIFIRKPDIFYKIMPALWTRHGWRILP